MLQKKKVRLSSAMPASLPKREQLLARWEAAAYPAAAKRDAALDAVARAWRLPPPRDDEADDELPVLDRSMFDLTNDSWFANLVRDDYYLAETIYAGGFIACMMMVSQALVRYLLFPH